MSQDVRLLGFGQRAQGQRRDHAVAKAPEGTGHQALQCGLAGGRSGIDVGVGPEGAQHLGNIVELLLHPQDFGVLFGRHVLGLPGAGKANRRHQPGGDTCAGAPGNRLLPADRFPYAACLDARLAAAHRVGLAGRMALGVADCVGLGLGDAVADAAEAAPRHAETLAARDAVRLACGLGDAVTDAVALADGQTATDRVAAAGANRVAFRPAHPGRDAVTLHVADAVGHAGAFYVAQAGGYAVASPTGYAGAHTVADAVRLADGAAVAQAVRDVDAVRLTDRRTQGRADAHRVALAQLPATGYAEAVALVGRSSHAFVHRTGRQLDGDGGIHRAAFRCRNPRPAGNSYVATGRPRASRQRDRAGCAL